MRCIYKMHSIYWTFQFSSVCIISQHELMLQSQVNCQFITMEFVLVFFLFWKKFNEFEKCSVNNFHVFFGHNVFVMYLQVNLNLLIAEKKTHRQWDWNDKNNLKRWFSFYQPSLCDIKTNKSTHTLSGWCRCCKWTLLISWYMSPSFYWISTHPWLHCLPSNRIPFAIFS